MKKLILLKDIMRDYNDLKSLYLNIDMSRGKPAKEQLDLSLPMMNVLSSSSNYVSEEGIDVRNYGALLGIKECRILMSEVLNVPFENVIVFGNSSLKVMYDLISKSFTHGVLGNKPWSQLDKIKWICLIPGYDRHFAILEHFGIEMIFAPLKEDGPDMDKVEELIKDESVKGLWCVPKHSNPSGVTYSDEVVKRLAKLSPKAKDFRIYWDNAYALSDFDKEIPLLNIYEEAKKVGNEDIVYLFTSTSKISFPGGGVAAFGASKRNIEDVANDIKYQIISYDKINQLRHVRYFKDLNGLKAHAKKHASILKKKFDIVEEYLSKYVSDIAKWNKPDGGYFFCLEVNNAKEVIEKCKKCGVILTGAGATHPYHNDPTNSHIRLAPSYLSEDDLRLAMEVICASILLVK